MKLLYSAMITKTKTTRMIMAAALLCGIGNVCALPLRILIEEQHAKIEPGIKKFLARFLQFFEIALCSCVSVRLPRTAFECECHS